MKYSDFYDKVSKEMDMPVEIIKRVYISYWEFIKKTIKELPLKKDLTEEEFSKLRTNFNIPSLGKMHCNYNRINGVKKRYKCFKDINDAKNKED